MTTDTASIEIGREFDRFSDHFRVYEVVFDETVIGRLGPGECSVFEVAAGSHELYMKIDWCRSEKVDVSLAAGQAIKFRCAPRSNVLTDLYWVTLGRHRYIELIQLTADGTLRGQCDLSTA